MKSANKVVTLVFCDIEHSTQLVQQLREAYPELLERYRNTIRESINRHNGREIDTSGDGFFMAFNNPDDAVLSASEIQKKISSEAWATIPKLKVRIGVHTGEALSTKTGYAGVEVHTASRICDAAHGGQIIVSSTSKNMLNSNILSGHRFTNLGDYNLKDIQYPVRLFQLNVPGSLNFFPKPRIEPDEKKIIILPFINLNKNEEYNYVGDGIAEEMIVALGKVNGLRVASRSTSFSLRSQDLDAREIRKKLNVDSVLDGRVWVDNGQIRVSVELVDARTGLNIWADQFQDSRDHLVTIQDDIIHKITELLGFPLIPEQQDPIKFRQSRNAEAYDYYLRGRRFYFQFSSRGIDLAIQMFQKAIDADRNYALAYAGIADSYSYTYQHKVRSQEILSKADEASKKAISLSPDLAEALVSRGIVLSLLKDNEASELFFEKAIEQDPTLFLGWFHYGRACFASGNLEKAARLFQQANRVEPEDFQSILLSAQVYDDFGSHDFAQILRKRGIEIAYGCLDINPGDTRAMYFAANALALLGEKEDSLKLLHTALTVDPNDSMLLYNAGCVYALLNMTQEALSCLERGFEAGLTLKGWYENDSNLDSLREEARFINLMAKL